MGRLAPGVAILWIVVGSFTATADATIKHWNFASGAWTLSGRWSPVGVPGPSDDVFVDYFTNGIAGSVTINTTTISAVTSITVLNGGTVSTADLFGGVGSILCGTDFVVGKSSTSGTVNVLRLNSNPFAGGMTVAANLRLGALSGSGAVNQNAGTVAVGNRAILGDSNQAGSEFKGFGTYTLSGGMLRAPVIEVGLNDADGVLNVSGSGVLNATTLGVGRADIGQFRGRGTVNQTGGQVNLTRELELGAGFPTNEAVYNLSAGVLSTASTYMSAGTRLNYSGGSISLGDLTVYAHQNSSNGARITLSAGGGKVMNVGHIFVSPTAVIDLNDNQMISTDAFAGSVIWSYINRGYNAGAWNGDGITSTAARLNPAHITALGYGPQAGGWKVKYTYYGDANLNGRVDAADYAVIDSSFNNQVTQGNIGDWFNGDFNYDRKISGADYALIDTSFNAQTGTLPRMLDFLDGTNRDRSDMTSPSLRMTLAHFDQFGEGYAAAVLSNAPEPASSLLFAGLAISMASRRRRS